MSDPETQNPLTEITKPNHGQAVDLTSGQIVEFAASELPGPHTAVEIHHELQVSHPAASSGPNLPPTAAAEALTTAVDYGPFQTTVRPIGAWVKPLRFSPPATPREPGTPRNYDAQAVENQIAAFWPTLSEGIQGTQKKKQAFVQATEKVYPNLPVDKLPPPAVKDDGTLRFPWAARMNKESRNLFRAAEPTYRLDGTPEVTIPSKVLMLGPENKDEYVVGQFHRCSTPPGGLIHAVVNRLWGRNCKIGSRKLGDSSFMFHIPHESTRKWVIQRGVWHIDDCLLFVAPWSPTKSFNIPEITSIPVWVTLKNIPDCCYSRLGISHIASGLGEPMLTHKPRLDPINMGEAKILVEVELDKPFPKLIALDDKQGTIYLVEIEYTWIPSVCERCGNLGHREKRCLLATKPLDNSSVNNQDQVKIGVPTVDIDHLLNQTTAGSTSPGPSLVKDQQALQTLSPKTVSEKTTTLSVSNQFSLLNEQTVDSDVTWTEKSKEKNYQHQMTPITYVELVSEQEENLATREVANTTTARDTIDNTNSSSIFHPKLPTSPQETATTTSLLSAQEVTLQDFSNTTNSSITLAGGISAQDQNTSKEDIPSTIIIAASQQATSGDLLIVTPNVQHQRSQEIAHETHWTSEHDPGLGDGSETISNMTRGGRMIKPTQKVQDMEWLTVGGRGKHGRRGRGNHHPR